MSIRVMILEFLRISRCPQQKDMIQRHLESKSQKVQDFFIEYTLLGMVSRCELVQINLSFDLIYYCLPENIPFGREKKWFYGKYVMGEKSLLQIFRTVSLNETTFFNSKERLSRTNTV